MPNVLTSHDRRERRIEVRHVGVAELPEVVNQALQFGRRWVVEGAGGSCHRARLRVGYDRFEQVEVQSVQR